MIREKKQINIDIGRRIRQTRESQGITREYLAELTEFGVRYLGMVETGVAGISIEGLRTFSAKLGVSVDYLINGSQDVYFKNISDKLLLLREQDPSHIENIETILSAYINGTKTRK